VPATFQGRVALFEHVAAFRVLVRVVLVCQLKVDLADRGLVGRRLWWTMVQHNGLAGMSVSGRGRLYRSKLTERALLPRVMPRTL